MFSLVGELDRNAHTCLTQLYDGRDTYIIYYLKNNYMFRHFSLAIFRLINEKNLVSSYTQLVWVVYSGEVRGEVGTRSRISCVGWVAWVHGFCYFCYSRLIQLDLWYHLMFVEIICTCTLVGNPLSGDGVVTESRIVLVIFRFSYFFLFVVLFTHFILDVKKSCCIKLNNKTIFY